MSALVGEWKDGRKRGRARKEGGMKSWSLDGGWDTGERQMEEQEENQTWNLCSMRETTPADSVQHSFQWILKNAASMKTVFQPDAGHLMFSGRTNRRCVTGFVALDFSSFLFHVQKEEVIRHAGWSFWEARFLGNLAPTGKKNDLFYLFTHFQYIQSLSNCQVIFWSVWDWQKTNLKYLILILNIKYLKYFLYCGLGFAVHSKIITVFLNILLKLLIKYC